VQIYKNAQEKHTEKLLGTHTLGNRVTKWILITWCKCSRYVKQANPIEPKAF